MTKPISSTHSADRYVYEKLERTAAVEATLNETHARGFEQLASFTRLLPGARVLDVACGTGTWATYLATQGCCVHCVDLHAGFAAAARANARRFDCRLWPMQADGTALPYRDSSFDVVTLFSVLEHVPDWEALVAEGLRVLKPGGTLWLTTTNRRCPITEEIQGFPGFPWYPAALQDRIMHWVAVHRPELVGHSPAPAIHWFTYDELMQHLADQGCDELATLVDYLQLKRRSWKSVVLEALRVSPTLRRCFWIVQPGVSLMAKKRGPAQGGERLRLWSVERDEVASTVLDAQELNAVLMCPECGTALHDSGTAEIDCVSCGLSYPVRDGIPAMLVGEAKRKLALGGRRTVT